jgi:hypothetical protein
MLSAERKIFPSEKNFAREKSLALPRILANPGSGTLPARDFYVVA